MIIHSLKLVDYLHVQADNPWYNYYMSTEIEANNWFVMTFNLRMKTFATFTFVVKDIFNLQSKTSTDFLTSFSNVNKYFNV